MLAAQLGPRHLDHTIRVPVGGEWVPLKLAELVFARIPGRDYRVKVRGFDQPSFIDLHPSAVILPGEADQ